MKAFDVAVVGEIFADHIFSGFECWPQPGQEIYTEDYAREVGGGAAITACALARLGRTAAVFGIVCGKDTWIHERLAEFGVLLDGLQCSPLPTAVTVSVSTREDRSFFTYRGANRLLPSYLAKPEVQSKLAEARHVHFAMPLSAALGETLLPRLKAAGCVLSLDPGYQREWLKDAQCRQVCGRLDYFLPNEEEGRLITGQTEPSGILAALEKERMPGVVLKLGPAGAATLVGVSLYRAASPSVNVVDTTGAGDAFDAGFIDALLDVAPLQQAMQRACVCGALSTRAAGALNALPDRRELDVFYEKLKQQ